MTDLTLPDFPIEAETLIGEARTARERQAGKQVATHIRGVLSRIKNFTSQKVTRMLYVNQSYHGHIRGLRLPQNAWQALQNAEIGTLDELKAVAVRIEQFPGVGPKTAQMIRAELDRLALL